ncbi:hypothetical protein YC2023_028482 [Brassica napus]
MTTSEMEDMEAGEVAISNKYGSRKFWGITLLCSVAAMSTSLLIFCLTGKANNMGGATATAFTSIGNFLIIEYALLGTMEMWCGISPLPPPGDSPQDIGPVDMAGSEMLGVVLICVITLYLGKIVEVFVYTMSSITGLVAICQLASPTLGKDHLWLIFGAGTVSGLICLVPILFTLVGWFSILIFMYGFIVRFNFPDKTLVEVFAIVSEILGN